MNRKTLSALAAAAVIGATAAGVATADYPTRNLTPATTSGAIAAQVFGAEMHRSMEWGTPAVAWPVRCTLRAREFWTTHVHCKATRRDGSSYRLAVDVYEDASVKRVRGYGDRR